MKLIDINTTLIEGYLKLLGNLSPNTKLDLISKLSLSLKLENSDDTKSFFKAYAAWKSDETAEEMIEEINNSRTFTRQNEKF
jgi:hypothetical protein